VKCIKGAAGLVGESLDVEVRCRRVTTMVILRDGSGRVGLENRLSKVFGTRLVVATNLAADGNSDGEVKEDEDEDEEDEDGILNYEQGSVMHTSHVTRHTSLVTPLTCRETRGRQTGDSCP